MSPYIADRGGVAESERTTGLQVTVLARIDPTRADRYDRLVDALGPLVDADQKLIAKPPWSETVPWGHLAWFRDAGTLGLHLPVRAHELAALTTWLGLDEVVLRIEDRDDLALFTALARARCTACSRKLEYLDPRLHDIETAQLLCRACGGFYDLSTFR